MKNTVWKNEALVNKFLDDVRGGIPFARAHVETLLRLAGMALPRGVKRFADIGCGDGFLSAAILARYPKAKGVLVDFSEPMLARARAKLGSHARQLKVAAADLGTPRWLRGISGQKPFDLIVSGFCIHHLPHARKKRLYAEIFRLLKPRGLFVNVEHVSSPSPWVETLSEEALIDGIWGFHKRRGGKKTRGAVARDFVRRPDKGANILAPVEDQCRWLRRIGFKDVDCYFKSFALAVFGGRKP